MRLAAGTIVSLCKDMERVIGGTEEVQQALAGPHKSEE